MASNLLESTSLVQVPIVKVTIGNYTFGVYSKSNGRITYPNYITSLSIEKVNGAVNKYTLQLFYPITENNDPNFMDALFGSVADTRNISFTYGDASQTDYLYKNEEATITSIDRNFDFRNSNITYTVQAVGTASLLANTSDSFEETYDKPSNIIKNLLANNRCGIVDIFYGFKNMSASDLNLLIPSVDVEVHLDAKPYISILDYILYLVSCMTSAEDAGKSIKSKIYVLSTLDDTLRYNGPIFKITEVDSNRANAKYSNVLQLDIGYPTANVVLDFKTANDRSYQLYYKYNKEISPQYYITRYNDKGEETIELVDSNLALNPETYESDSDFKTWWSNVTSYPITATITLKGLLQPTVLMSVIKLNVYFYGKKHSSSGYYVISKQVDNINTSGFTTELSLLRVAGDEDTTSLYSKDN